MNNDTHNRINYLLNQIQNAAATPEEFDELLLLMKENPDQAITDQIRASFGNRPVLAKEPDATNTEWRSLLHQVLAVDKTNDARVVPLHRRPFMRWLGWAAASIVLLAGAWWLLAPSPEKVNQVMQPPLVADKAPGKNGAILTLADGRKILLDSLGNGTIASEAGTTISIQNYQLVYHSNGQQAKHAADTFLNTMSTPRGRQYQLKLPDGTMVWLNAASSIRYPVLFGKERKVVVEGEAYFEVAKDATKPFRVLLTNGTEISVLGTSFNINSYSDEAGIRTTLVEGAVKITNGNEQVVLRPKQQALVQSGDINVQKADVEKVLAWKNGLFDFRDAPLAEVMRQLSRWYDVNVEYENGIPDLQFEGRLGRDVSLAKVLAFFNESGIRVRMEKNNKLVVSKK